MDWLHWALIALLLCVTQLLCNATRRLEDAEKFLTAFREQQQRRDQQQRSQEAFEREAA